MINIHTSKKENLKMKTKISLVLFSLLHFLQTLYAQPNHNDRAIIFFSNGNKTGKH